MKVLHILRSEPSELVRQLIQKMSAGDGGRQVPLYSAKVDYAQLLKDIFQSDRVICWW